MVESFKCEYMVDRPQSFFTVLCKYHDKDCGGRILSLRTMNEECGKCEVFLKTIEGDLNG